MLESKLAKIKDLSEKYPEFKEIQKNLEKIIYEYENFKIPMVFIGEFSSGKSSLINELINEDLLEVDTAPATAKPFEIYYSDNTNKYSKDGVEFLELNNQNLKHFKHIKLIDLPGISSQYLEHVNVTKDYLMKKSSIFVVVIDVSKGSISEEVLNFIDELKDFQKEYILVLTKTDKLEEKSDDVLETTLSVIKKSYKEPSYYCMVSAARREITSFVDILFKYEFKYDDIRDKNFIEEFQSIKEEIKTSIERTKTLLQFSNETDIQKFDEIIKELELELPILEEKKNAEIDKIKNSAVQEFDLVVSNLENKIYSNFEEYLKNPGLINQDVNGYLNSELTKANEKINSIFRSSLVDLTSEMGDLNSIVFANGILSKGGDVLKNIAYTNMATNASKALSFMPIISKLFVGGAAATEATATTGVLAAEATTGAAVAGEAAATGTAVAAETALSFTGVLIPVAIVSGIILHQVLDKVKRTKTKDNLKKMFDTIRTNVNSQVNAIIGQETNAIMESCASQVRNIRDQLREIKSEKFDKIDEKLKIIQMEEDLKLLESL